MGLKQIFNIIDVINSKKKYGDLHNVQWCVTVKHGCAHSKHGLLLGPGSVEFCKLSKLKWTCYSNTSAQEQTPVAKAPKVLCEKVGGALSKHDVFAYS